MNSVAAHAGCLLLKLRTTDSHDKIIYGHCKGLFKEANQIRNKYAHALYAKGVKMSMSPFHHDLKAPEKWIESKRVGDPT